MKLVLIASLFTSSFAACANSCSNHGSCGEHDKCTCDPNWSGGDCSLAKCPHGASWSKSTDGGEYSECSSRGSCDRKTGACQCLAGFSGTSCQRKECPESCSGHGVCEAPSTKGSRTALTVEQSCKCDPGWTGVSCAERFCPYGDDPLTKSDYDGSLNAAIAQEDEIQKVVVTSANIQAFTIDTFTMTYKTVHGHEYTTYPLYQLGLTEGKIERALEHLPDGVLQNVTVSLTQTKSSFENDFSITFNSNPGDQHPVVVNTDGCKIAGCMPLYFGFSGSHTVVYTETRKGTKENIECAGRGICDREKGECSCFNGFFGESCNDQSILA